MKNYIILSAVLFTIFSCNKTNSPVPPVTPAGDSLLKSFSMYSPQAHAKLIETFSYNGSSQLAGIHGYSYDTSSGTPSIDSAFISFAMTDTVTPPAAYDLAFHNDGDNPADVKEHHLVFYDNQKRVIRDSIASSSRNLYLVQHYIYDDLGNTTIQWLYPDAVAPGGYTINQVDTMFIQGDNIFTDILYSAVDGSFYHLFTSSYSTHINPLYNPSLSNSLGCLLVFNNIGGDYRSINLPDQHTDQENGSPSITLNYVWTTDSAGRVVQGIGTDNSSGLTGLIYNFTY
jgi:hypothetical protein